jgi:hypothetical protein
MEHDDSLAGESKTHSTRVHQFLADGIGDESVWILFIQPGGQTGEPVFDELTSEDEIWTFLKGFMEGLVDLPGESILWSCFVIGFQMTSLDGRLPI